MAHFRGVTVRGTVLDREDDDEPTFGSLVFFSADVLQAVTEIDDGCFGLSRDMSDEIGDAPAEFFRRHHDAQDPSILDLSMLENCTKIGDFFAVGHYGPVILPPKLQEVGRYFLMGAKVRVLSLPASLTTIEDMSFTFMEAGEIVLPAGVETMPTAAFAGSTLTTLAIPGSVSEIPKNFCAQATIGSVMFEPSKTAVTIQPDAFQDSRVTSKLVFHRRITFVWDQYRNSFKNATINLLQYSGARSFRSSFPPDVDIDFTGDDAPKVVAMMSGDVTDADLFPDVDFLLGDRTTADTCDDEPSSDAEGVRKDVDESYQQRQQKFLEGAASITHLEPQDCRYLVIGNTVDMSMMTQCRAFADNCFAELTAVDSITFPPNLASIGRFFMFGASCPALDVVFPKSLTRIGKDAMSEARLRSVDMSECEIEEFVAPDFMTKASVEFLTLPENLVRIDTQQPVLCKLDCPKLDLVLPKGLRGLGLYMLSHCTLHSLDMGRCGALTVLPYRFLKACTLSALTLPPALNAIHAEFMIQANSPSLDLTFPASLQAVNHTFLHQAKVRSLDFGNCALLVEVKTNFLNDTKTDSFVFPPNLKRAGEFFLKALDAPVDLVFPRTLKGIDGSTLEEAHVGSVDFGQCLKLRTLSKSLLSGATFSTFVFPPNVTTIDGEFMRGVKHPTLDLPVPSTVFICADGFLRGSHIRSVDLSACASLTVIKSDFMKDATAQQCLLPSSVISIKNECFSGFSCKSFHFTAPDTLRAIGSGVFSNANVGSIDIATSVPLEMIGHSFMSAARLDSPASLVFSSKLTSVGKEFCAGVRLQKLDMRLCEGMSKLRHKFLFHVDCRSPDDDRSPSTPSDGAVAANNATSTHNDNDGNDDVNVSVLLPPSITEVGDSCFAQSKGVKCLSVSSTSGNLRVGDSFAADSDVEMVNWASRRIIVGHCFCKNVPTLRLPSARGFAAVGDDFCAGVGELLLDLSKAPLSEIGTGFLQRSSLHQEITTMDFTPAMFTACPENFMSQTSFVASGQNSVVLPSTVSTIAPRCCAEMVGLKSFSFSASTSPLMPPATELSIQHDFLRNCRTLIAADLPTFVVSFGDSCFADCPALTIKLTLPNIKQIGNDFLAMTDRSNGEPHSPLQVSFSPRHVNDEEPKADNGASQNQPTVAFHDLCPYAAIGDNFAAHAHCTALSFAAAHSTADVPSQVSSFVERDEIYKELDGALSGALAAGQLKAVVALKELVSLRRQLLITMAETNPGFRSITMELDALLATDGESDSKKRDRADCLAKEMRCEEDHIFNSTPANTRLLLTKDHRAVQPSHDHALREIPELNALEHGRYSELMHSLTLKIKHLDNHGASGSSIQKRRVHGEKKSAPLPIGDGFLAHTTGISQLDLSGAMHSSIGDRFAAHSNIHEVQLPMSVRTIGRDMCAGCLATVSTAPFGGQDDCCLSVWMKIRVEKERMDTLTHFRDLLPTSEWAAMARWLLQQRCFAEFKGLFNVREDAASLRHVGGTVDDLPDLPGNVPAWPGFHLTVATHDSCLSLLHWAVKYSHQFPHLLTEASWSLADLTLVTQQGFTALHYAVLYDIESAALTTLLDIAAKAEIHSTWSTAWSTGGVRVSPLHLAYLYRRDAIVKELLAFEWDPTEPIKEADTKSGDAEGDEEERSENNFDAFDQALMELGQARTAAFIDARDAAASDEKAPRLPVAVQLFHAAVLMCVVGEFEFGINNSHTVDTGILRAFIVLRRRLSTDFPLLSQNKWAQARQRQRDIAARGSSESELFNVEAAQTFLQDAYAAAFSDPEHSSHVRIQYRHVLADTKTLSAFVATELRFTDEEISLKRPLTFSQLGSIAAMVQSRFRVIKDARQGPSAPPITTETLLLRTQSMEEGPHRSNVEDKLANVIPFRFVIPVLPFFYLMLLIVFGLSWFFHPPILAPTLMGIENAIADCTNPYNTKDATEDGVIPWDCDVGFTELGMQVETFPTPSTDNTSAAGVARMQSFFSFIEKENIPRNVTHLPWAYLRFSTVVNYNGLKTKATSVTDAEMPPRDSLQEYWVLTELQKLPDWAPEIFEQKNTKANESTISFKGETTRTFAHTVIPYGFGNHTLLVAWMIGVMVMLILCVAAFVYHGYAFSNILREREVRLVEVSTIQRSFRSILLACEVAAVLFIAVGVCLMAVTFAGHKADEIITRSTAGTWQRVEIFFRVGLTFCSFRAVSFFSEMPKPHHFAMVNAGVVGFGLIAALVGLYLIPTSRVGLAASVKSLLSIQAVDALTLPIVLAVALFFRSTKVSDEVRQAHYENLLADMDEAVHTNGEGEVEEMSDSKKPRASVLAARQSTSQKDHGTSSSCSVNKENKNMSPLPADRTSVNIDRMESPEEVKAQKLASDDPSPASAKKYECLNDTDGSESEASSVIQVRPFSSTPSNGVADQSPRSAEDDVNSIRSSRTHDKPLDQDPSQEKMAVINEVIGDTEEGKGTEEQEEAAAKENGKSNTATAAVRAVARRRRVLLSWAVIIVAGLGQVLLYGLAVTVVLRPLLTLPAPGGAFPVTGESFISSDDLGMANFAQKFLL